MSTFDEYSLQVFYSRLFPYDLMFEWLSYGHQQGDVDKDFFYQREFSFTKANDVYIRYLSFKNAQEFKERVKQDQPHKIDIGAVYTFPAKDHASVLQSKFRPTHRELVFDIDLTDYEEVQTNKAEDGLWHKRTWYYMACAIKIIDASLREDFGFEHLLWVFSGRRGVHCWVCDDSALELEDNERQAIVDYLSIVGGGGKSDTQTLDQRVKLMTPYHPSIRRALEIATPIFKKCCVSDEKGQGILANEERWNKILQMLPNVDRIRERLSEEWIAHPEVSSEHRWAQLEATIKGTVKSVKNFAQGESLTKALDAIILFHVYPRLDVNVSIHRNHLLKSPFVVHPKTGKVCVPIFDIENCEETFDPDNVPNLKTLLKELEVSTEKTSLTPVFERFKSDFLGSLKKHQRNVNRQIQEKRAAIDGNW